MGETSRGGLLTIRQLVLRSLHVGKWVFSAIWVVILAGIADSTISTWLTSKKFDPTGTPLGWIIQNLLFALACGVCLLLITILIWVVYFFLKRDTSWLYTIEERQRIKLRRLFATHIEHEIERISIQEDWKDYQFTELEAEVETRGRQKVPRILALFRQSSDRLRHERSLSEALRKSAEKIILVEGEPGSGKSVALRHVALEMIKQVRTAQNTDSVIPIYINMKLLERKNREEINRELIECFIISTLTRSNDRDVQRFLNNEFQNGVRDGTFFFLFDSFDEIPEVLNSTEADDKVNDYGKAIDDFLHGMNQCHGVIASRFYRGPARLGWTHFRIMPLREDRQLELIRKTNLVARANWVVGQLGNVNQTIRSMASNPFFLALLCKHLEDGHPFPANVHVVYETYINQRFSDDENELKRNFQLTIDQVRIAAETIAFCMTASTNLGLNPTRIDLQNALVTLGLNINNSLEKLLDALEYMKLARPDTATNTSLSKSFTFSHRRFQEYFATCFVLREPFQYGIGRVTSEQLLTQGSWRETAVVLCQTQPIEKLTPLITEAERLLVEFCINLPDLVDNPEEYVINKKLNTTTNFQTPLSRFFWPNGLFHLLSLLQDGFASRLTELPRTIRIYIDKLLLSASEQRTRDDKKWTLEVAGIASEPILEYILNEAFASNSQLLKEVAYRQVARLSNIPPSVAKGIRSALLRLAASKRLHQEQHSTEAHLKRLSEKKGFLSVMRLLLWFPFLDNLSLVVFTLTLFPLLSPLYSYGNPTLIDWRGLIFINIFCLIFLLLFNSYPIIIAIFTNDLSIIISNRYAFRISVLFLSLIGLLLLIFEIFQLIFVQRLNINVFYLFIAIYSISYSPLTVGTLLIGNYTNLLWWPFIPFWPFVYVLQHTSSVFSYLQKKISLIGLWRSLQILTILFIFTPIILICIFYWKTLLNNVIFIAILSLLGGLLLLFVFLFYLGLLYFLLISVYRGLTLELGYYIWKKSLKRQIDFNEFYRILKKYWFIDKTFVRTIKIIQEKQVLDNSQLNIGILEGITFKIEKKLRARELKAKVRNTEYSYRLVGIVLNTLLRKKSYTLRSLCRRIRIQKIIRQKLRRKPLTGEQLFILRADDIALDELYNLLIRMRTNINIRVQAYN